MLKECFLEISRFLGRFIQPCGVEAFRDPFVLVSLYGDPVGVARRTGNIVRQ